MHMSSRWYFWYPPASACIWKHPLRPAGVYPLSSSTEPGDFISVEPLRWDSHLIVWSQDHLLFGAFFPPIANQLASWETCPSVRPSEIVEAVEIPTWLCFVVEQFCLHGNTRNSTIYQEPIPIEKSRNSQHGNHCWIFSWTTAGGQLMQARQWAKNRTVKNK